MDSPAYTLPDHLRSLLKQPLGILMKGDQLKTISQTTDILISVGDHVSASLIKQNIFPQLIIIDYKTRRGDISPNKKELLDHLPDYETVKVSNPAGIITEETMNSIQSICSTITTEDKIMLIVEGEEDLTALPAILYAPINATIIYGMPYKGVVIVPSTEEYKEKVRHILSEM